MNYYHEKRYKISKKNSYSNNLHNKLNNRTLDPTIFSKDPTIREKTQKGEMNNNL